MSSVALRLPSQPAPAPVVFMGRARWLAATVLITGPLLQVVEFLLVTATDDNAARVAFWAANPTRVAVSMAAGLLAVPFLLGGVAVLIALTRIHSPRLAWTAGALMVFAMSGLAAVHGYELAAFGLTLAGAHPAATSVLSMDTVTLPAAVLLVMFLGGAALGTLTLAAAMWRSPLVPRAAAFLVVAFAVLDFALGQPVLSHLVNLVGFTIVAAAVVARYSRPVAAP